jgi:hypothetical protein
MIKLKLIPVINSNLIADFNRIRLHDILSSGSDIKLLV